MSDLMGRKEPATKERMEAILDLRRGYQELLNTEVCIAYSNEGDGGVGVDFEIVVHR